MKLNDMRMHIFVIGALLVVCMYLAMHRYKPDESAALAAWVQAIGSIIAILGAVWIASEQERSRKADHGAETVAFVQAVATEIRTIWTG